jgi:hypothetical protein
MGVQMVLRRPFHRLLSALAGVVTLLGLAGCSPDPHPYLALTMVNDRPTLLIAACARSQVSSITLSESDNTVAREWSVAAPLSTPAPNGVKHPTVAAPARIALFEKPSSWLIRQETMRAFRDDAEYRVHGGLANVASLEFTVARLRELAPGMVLTGVGYQDQHVVPEADFEKAAQKDCDGPRRG